MIFNLLAILTLFGVSIAEKNDKAFPCWKRKDDSVASGFVPAPHTAVETCMRYCLTLTSCSAIIWDEKNDPPCSVQIKITDSLKVVSKTGSRVYFLDRICLEPHITPYGPEICWGKKTKIFYNGLTNINTTSLRGCLNACSNNDGCQVTNFILDSETPCSIQTIKSPIAKRNFTARASSACFILNRECLNYFTNVQIENRELCWRPLKDLVTNYVKVERPSRTSCMDYCQDTADCQAVKFDKSCSVSMMKTQPNNKYSSDELAGVIGLERSCL